MEELIKLINANKINDLTLNLQILKGRFEIPTKIQQIKDQLKFRKNGDNS